MKKDLELMAKRGKNLEKCNTVIELILSSKPLPLRYKDHPLKANFKGYRDCHIEPDWLLIYKLNDTELYLLRTGSHADLFKV